MYVMLIDITVSTVLAAKFEYKWLLKIRNCMLTTVNIQIL